MLCAVMPPARPLLPLLAALALACGPDADALTERVLSAEVEEALPELADLPGEHELGAWGDLARELQALEAERQAVRAQETAMLLEAARARLDSDDPAGAVAPIAAGLEGHPGEPGFRALAEELAARAQGAPPAQAARIYLSLAEIHRADPALSESYHQQAAQQALRARYGEAALAETRAGQEGVSAAAARGVLARVDLEYHVVPDWAAMEQAGRRQLGWLRACPEARALWPDITIWPLPATAAEAPDSLESTLAALERTVRVGADHGVPAEVLRDEWVRGALGALDPWTRAVWPAEIASWTAHHAGVTVGVGLRFTELEGVVLVDRPELDSPAWESRIHQGDALLAVEDARGRVVLAELPADGRLAVAEALMEGDPGSPVALSLRTPDGEEYTEILRRDGVPMETLRGLSRGADNAWELWLDREAGLAYVRVLAFREHTEPAFDALLEPHLDEVQGLVLDLRGNPGGDVDAAVQLADRFVEEGFLVEISGRVMPETGPDTDPVTGEPLADWNQALRGHALEGVALVVLVDAESASASEVLAGSLEELAGAVVVGEATWGKGYAQALRTDPEGRFALQLTNLVWTLPSGRRLARELDGGGGIQPQVPLVLSPGEGFQADLLSRQRAALRAHADGTPLVWTDTVVREDLAPLSEDPALVLGELVLRALLRQRSAAAGS